MTIEQIMNYGFTKIQAKQLRKRFADVDILMCICTYGPQNFELFITASDKKVDAILSAEYREFDINDCIVGWGSHADYDLFAREILNGDGYYDDDGHYRSFNQNRLYW